MTTTTTPAPELTRNRVIIAAIFGIVAVVCIIVGLAIGFAPAHALPHALTGSSKGHHPIRVVAAVFVGIVFAVASYFALKYEGPAEDAE